MFIMHEPGWLSIGSFGSSFADVNSDGIGAEKSIPKCLGDRVHTTSRQTNNEHFDLHSLVPEQASLISIHP